MIIRADSDSGNQHLERRNCKTLGQLKLITKGEKKNLLLKTSNTNFHEKTIPFLKSVNKINNLNNYLLHI